MVRPRALRELAELETTIRDIETETADHAADMAIRLRSLRDRVRNHHSIEGGAERLKWSGRRMGWHPPTAWTHLKPEGSKMQFTLLPCAAAPRKPVSRSSVQKRIRRIIPRSWKLPALDKRRAWLPQFLAHFAPELVTDGDAWAAPIGECGPMLSDDLRVWLVAAG